MFAASVFDHVLDSQHWPVFENWNIEFHLPWFLTKYMVLMLLGAVILCLIFIPLGKRAGNGAPVRGPLWNAFESLLTFIRDKVAKVYIGHDYDRYVPFLWTLFLFILVCNLLGMIPFLGSPTASFSVTVALAIIAFVAIHGSAIAHLGVGTYFKSYVPNLDLPFGMGYFVIPMIAVIEFISAFIKAFVLAVRLFANMFAGHMVLAVLLSFIVMAKDMPPPGFWSISAVSALAVVGLSLLELFVAFLQAFIFTFLTALFLGTQLHPHH